jgi:phosphoglycolate phosphatase
MPVEPKPAMVLFDIDGTLVRRAGSHHRQALVDAVRRVTGLETTTDHIPVHGMLDPDILTRMMRDAGARAGAIRQAMPRIIEEAQRIYMRGVPDLRRKTCPGVRRLLRRMQNSGLLLGLVTGNLTRIGWHKLDRAGLKPYFRWGAFGEMARDRAGLARWAIRQARAQGWISRGAPVSLIGDAPSDIQAARRNGIRAIAVCTGVTPRAELEACGPDLLLEDLRELQIEMVSASPGSRRR